MGPSYGGVGHLDYPVTAPQVVFVLGVVLQC